MIFYALIASMSINILVLFFLVLILLKQRRTNKHLSTLGKEAKEGNLPHIINQSFNRLDELSNEVENLNKYYSNIFRHNNSTLQNIGLVRYDAFEDVGGNLSFSLALLNNQKDGVTLTSINGRNEHRLYVKQIVAGLSNDMPLAEEEVAAIKQALKHSRKIFMHEKDSKEKKQQGSATK